WPAAARAAEETFLFALRSIASFPPGEAFRTWLYRIAVDQCLPRRRSSARGAAGSAAAARIRGTLARFEPLDRACFALQVIEDLPAEEAAAVLRLAPEEIRGRTHRTLIALTAALSQFVL